MLVLLAALAHAADAYHIGPGDTISILVYGEDTLSRQVVVSPSCSVDAVLIGAVQVCDRTAEEVAAEVTSRYGADFLVDPHVIVEVTAYGAHKVEVRGAVRAPGLQVLSGPTTLVDLIGLAGGPVDGSVTDVQIQRSGGAIEVYTLGDLPARDPVYVEPGDILTVMPGRVVYVRGEIKNVGSQPFHAGLTISEAVAQAGGLSEFGSSRRIYILRGRGAESTKIRVNLHRIELGAEEDIELVADDQIVVRRAIL